jgi:SagB-type dehydrogenase family enzyme
MPLEQAIARRRSMRSFTAEPLSEAQIGQLLWAAQGITEPQRGLRAAPSAGALYPLELYAVTGDGVYHYVPRDHSLELVGGGDVRGELAVACLGQACVAQAAADFVLTAVFARTRSKYGQRADQYVHNEVGAAGENLCLQAVAMDLGSVMVGAFNDGQVSDTLSLPPDHHPLLVIPVGHVP